MSREIKFRAWNQDNQKFGYFVFGTNGHYTFTKDLEAHSTNAVKEWQQFTGLKDKNGVEIYEGDILEVKGQYAPAYKQQMVWNSNGWWLTDTLGNYHLPNREYLEAIGNIYENSELLK